jgi:preprotein translocase subunit SecF
MAEKTLFLSASCWQHRLDLPMPLLRFLPEATTLDFVRWRWWAIGFDTALTIAAVFAIVLMGFNLGLDFTGGAQVEVRAKQTIDLAQIRSDVEGLGFGHPVISTFGGGACDNPAGSCAVIRVQPQVAEGADVNQANQAVVQAIRAKLGSGFTFSNTEMIGPKVSGELFSKGIWATVLAILMIAVWVWFRFEWQYGVAALVATGHDVLVTAGFYAFFQWDFGINTVAALLLLAGYSINDTVVVFDRIRENRRKYKRMTLPDLINLSTNQILTRTILVSVTTALAVIPLLFGGAVLLNFSMVIIIGIVVGTFSSVYVASMLLLFMPAIGRSAPEKDKDTAVQAT